MTMCICLKSQSQPSEACIWSQLEPVQHDSIVSIRSVKSDDLSTPTSQWQVYMHLSLTTGHHAGWVAQVHYRQMSVCWRQQLALLLKHRNLTVTFFSPLSLLCWLDILHCVQYKLRVAIYRCLWNQAPHYQMDCAYISVISVCDQPTNNQLVWPHYCHRKFGSCIFHRLPDEMELCLMRSIDSFTITLKTRSFAVHWH